MSKLFLRAGLSALALAAACSANDATNPGTPDFRYGVPGGGGGMPGGETAIGNNLSVPVIFAEGYGLTGLPVNTATVDSTTGLRVPAGAAITTLPDYYLDPASATVTLPNGSTGYCQQTGHTWMAQWSTGPTSATVDWGDNLTSVQFTSTSIIRIETALVAPTTATGFNMYLYSGTRTTEMQCTDLTEGTFSQNVYSVAPRLRLYKVSADGASPTTAPLIDLAVADKFGQDGPGLYGAELNVAGKVVYGYNLAMAGLTLTDKKGWYLVSFSLDANPVVGGVAVPNGVTLTGVADANAQLTSPTESRIWFQVSDSRGKKGGGGGGGHGGGQGGQGGMGIGHMR